MDDQVFSQAVNELFFMMDLETRKEIIRKVTDHIKEFAIRLINSEDPKFLDEICIEQATPINFWKKSIDSYLSSLSENNKERISKEIDQELTRVMHQIYLIYNNSLKN